MFHGKKIVVVMPAYNAAKTIEQTYREIPLDLVDEVIVTDDASRDETVEVAKRLGLRTIVHETSTAATAATRRPATRKRCAWARDVVVMLHPDYQYTPKLLPAMIGLITDGPFDVVLGLAGPGRPRPGRRHAALQVPRQPPADRRRELAARRQALGVPHGLPRLLPSKVLESLPLLENSDDFVFDNQMLAQIQLAGFEIGEVSCPAAYFEEASSINYLRRARAAKHGETKHVLPRIRPRPHG